MKKILLLCLFLQFESKPYEDYTRIEYNRGKVMVYMYQELGGVSKQDFYSGRYVPRVNCRIKPVNGSCWQKIKYYGGCLIDSIDWNTVGSCVAVAGGAGMAYGIYKERSKR